MASCKTPQKLKAGEFCRGNINVGAGLVPALII